jgi:hypothetical protein
MTEHRRDETGQPDAAPSGNVHRTTPPKNRYRIGWTLVVALVLIAGVWVGGAIWSFAEQTAYARFKHFEIPELLPLVIDGLAIAMAAVAWAASLDGRAAVLARAGAAIAVCGSAGSNAAWAWERSKADPGTIALAVAVPIAANIAFEVLLAELRKQVQRGSWAGAAADAAARPSGPVAVADVLHLAPAGPRSDGSTPPVRGCHRGGAGCGPRFRDPSRRGFRHPDGRPGRSCGRDPCGTPVDGSDTPLSEGSAAVCDTPAELRRGTPEPLGRNRCRHPCGCGSGTPEQRCRNPSAEPLRNPRRHPRDTPGREGCRNPSDQRRHPPRNRCRQGFRDPWA